MSLKSKIEAVIYASEEPVTLQQLVGLLAGEAQAELDEIAANQASLPLNGEEPGQDATPEDRVTLEAGTHQRTDESYSDELDHAVAEALEQGEVAGAGAGEVTAEQAASEDAAHPAEDQDKAEDVAKSADATDGEAIPAPENVPSGEEVSASEDTTDEEAAPTPNVVAAVGDPEPNPVEVSTDEDKRVQRDRERAVRDHIRRTVDMLIRDYAESERGIEIREVASGFRMGTKPEFHDAVRGFVKSLKPALKLTLPALETLAVVAYKQPVTAAEISEIRGVDSAGVLGGLMTRKLIATAGRKQVIGRPMLYKTTRDFLLRFGLKDVNELPSMEEFERMAGELAEQEDLPMEGAENIIEEANARGDAEHIRETNGEAGEVEADATVYAEGVEAAPEPAEILAMEEDIEKATAESAAGGNSEEVNEERASERGEENNETAEPVEATEPETAESGTAAEAGVETAQSEEPQTAG
jgi:segregation and condensation protein B